MCHITLGKVKTSMLLIWAGPDGEDIYENFNLPPHLRHDVERYQNVWILVAKLFVYLHLYLQGPSQGLMLLVG